jgi:uncharacterized protein YbjT (DUF2867 family)
MQVFITGGTGLIGSAVVAELLGNGHAVLALARSDTSATALKTAGAQTIRGDLADLGTLRAGASGADGVIHLAFANDFSSPAALGAAVAEEGAALAALGDELTDSGRPLITVSGTPYVTGRASTEADPLPTDGPVGGRGALLWRSWTWPRGESGARPSAFRARSTTKAGADSLAC